MKIAIYRLAVLGLLLLGWWAAARVAGANLVPTPGETLAAASRLLADGRILTATMESLRVYFGGYILAALIGIPLGLAMGAHRDLGRTLEVFVNALMATPRVAFIPLIIVFLGLGPEAKIVVVFLGAVLPILANTYAGILNSDDDLIEMARSMGASRPQIYLRIMLPGALPFVAVGLRLGATIGLINTVVAELYTAVRGLGGLLAVYGNTFQMAPYFVVVFVLASIGTIVTQGLRVIEARTERLRYDGGS
jgi:NitT/TauT family transport system permease protein